MSSTMTPPRRWALAAACVACAAVSLGFALAPTAGAAPFAAAQNQLPIERIEFASGHDIPSSVCGKCHADIYEVWKTSVHAQSFADPVFQAGLAQAITSQGSDVAQTCLSCHAPGAMLMQPPVGVVEPEREGIGCRFCHAIRGVDLGTFPPFELETELVMMGSMNAAESPVHEIRASALLGTPEYCGSCHEYTTPGGAALLTTYSEFANAGHPDYLACQDCHMAYVLGQVVDTSVRQADEFSFVDSHSVPGGRNLAQVRRAMGLEIVSLERGSGSIDLRVAVANTGSGHWIPTGMPSKQIILEVTTSWDDFERSERFTFGRRVVDDSGNRLRTVAEMMTRGASIPSDTRLRPGQRREFNYTLPAPVDADATLVVQLFYESTEPAARTAEKEVIYRIERDL